MNTKKKIDWFGIGWSIVTCLLLPTVWTLAFESDEAWGYIATTVMTMLLPCQWAFWLGCSGYKSKANAEIIELRRLVKCKDIAFEIQRGSLHDAQDERWLWENRCTQMRRTLRRMKGRGKQTYETHPFFF